MQCPVCQTELRIMERQSIEIDYCPQCRGVWLDRGELDKIIERSATERPAEIRANEPRREYAAPPRDERHYEERSHKDDRPYKRDYDDDDDYHRHKRHKKRGFLSEIFDFD